MEVFMVDQRIAIALEEACHTIRKPNEPPAKSARGPMGSKRLIGDAGARELQDLHDGKGLQRVPCRNQS